jgi:hypothetical protein
MDLRKTKSVGDLPNPKFRAGFEGTEIKASWGNEEVVLNLRVDIPEEFRTEKDPETRDVEVRIPRSELPKDKDKPSRLFPVENTSIAIQVVFNPNEDRAESYFSIIKRNLIAEFRTQIEELLDAWKKCNEISKEKFVEDFLELNYTERDQVIGQIIRSIAIKYFPEEDPENSKSNPKPGDANTTPESKSPKNKEEDPYPVKKYIAQFKELLQQIGDLYPRSLPIDIPNYFSFYSDHTGFSTTPMQSEFSIDEYGTEKAFLNEDSSEKLRSFNFAGEEIRVDFLNRNFDFAILKHTEDAIELKVLFKEYELVDKCGTYRAKMQKIKNLTLTMNKREINNAKAGAQVFLLKDQNNPEGRSLFMAILSTEKIGKLDDSWKDEPVLLLNIFTKELPDYLKSSLNEGKEKDLDFVHRYLENYLYFLKNKQTEELPDNKDLIINELAKIKDLDQLKEAERKYQEAERKYQEAKKYVEIKNELEEILEYNNIK